MIVVIGSATARDGKLDELLALGLEHVRRSRTEPGCISHGVSRDAENPARLVFVEEWADETALAAHFAVPASRKFVKAALALTAAPPSMTIYKADVLKSPLR
jgi:quinol monooxygenase YgiN